PPFGEQIAEGIFQLNYEKLGYKTEPHVTSPYTKNTLPFVMDEDGRLFIDYRVDLMHVLQEVEHDYESGDDIRKVLEDNYPFVPAYSLPYTIKEAEPVFMLEK